MTKEMLEKQIKELRARLSNFSTKREMSEDMLREKIKSLSSELCDKDDQVRMLQQYIAEREKKVDELMETLSFKDKEIEKLTDEIAALRDQRDKFKAMLSKDSANSSKPPSTDGFRKAKATSLRERSGKKPGGQFGHPGRTIQFYPEPNIIIEKNGETPRSCQGMHQLGQEYRPKQESDD